MGHWYFALFLSCFLILIGLYLHWSVILFGALLPVIPMLSLLRERRRKAGRRPGGDQGH